MDMLLTLNDLKEMAKDSGNENPCIFLLSDMKTKEQADESWCPTNIFIDDSGSIVIQFNEEMLHN